MEQGMEGASTSVQAEEWRAITPEPLILPVEHIRNMFDEGVWKCSSVTEKLCFAALHPDDKHTDLGPYNRAFAQYSIIIGAAAAQEFDRIFQTGTPPAFFHAYFQAMDAGIRTEIRRLFTDLLKIAVTHSAKLEKHPAEWAKLHLSMLINSKKHVITTWIKSVCDTQDYSKLLSNEQDTEDLIFWRDWRAPKLIYMQPSGNLRYDPSTAWSREDEKTTGELLDALSTRFIEFLGFGLDKLVGDAHVTLAKSNLITKERAVAKSNKPNAGPTAFISYSWDSAEHKQWVLELAHKLRLQGVNAILDRWDLPIGGDRTLFMEQSIATSNFVLIVCTPSYATKADTRGGGVGYEAMIITSQLARKIEQTRFIPVLRSGKWESSLPIWIQSKIGVDLRGDPYDEGQYDLLLRRLHQADLKAPAVGPIPAFSDGTGSATDDLIRKSTGTDKRTNPESEPNEYWEQRKRLPETDLLKQIWTKPYWRIWIRSTEFRPARFQTLEQAKQFVFSSEITIRDSMAYPSFSPNRIEFGDEWVACETEHSTRVLSWSERWSLFRSGQFVHYRNLQEIPHIGERVHVLEVLDTVTAVFEFAVRMSNARVLSPTAAVTFELHGVDGRSLTWQQDLIGDIDAVPRDCWCQEKTVSSERRISTDELRPRARELARDVALEIYHKFNWSEPTVEKLKSAQDSRFGNVY